MPSGLKFVEGSKTCGLCGTSKNIIQFERDTKRKGLPIIEIAFICETCAVKEGLIKHSKLVGDKNGRGL